MKSNITKMHSQQHIQNMMKMVWTFWKIMRWIV